MRKATRQMIDAWLLSHAITQSLQESCLHRHATSVPGSRSVSTRHPRTGCCRSTSTPGPPLEVSWPPQCSIASCDAGPRSPHGRHKALESTRKQQEGNGKRNDVFRQGD
ncbi:uncharacterized protein LOC119091180 [Pollicipes pollicipes]|uniref:uncharacterized protein LOC119091180 n=1 Tax=Pollicipes pollicipes TaxID=41117 RepID=UPI00188539DB|nr:uncharacterized protein LOC119091180 [Pollicipes pollicipes]